MRVALFQFLVQISTFTRYTSYFFQVLETLPVRILNFNINIFVYIETDATLVFSRCDSHLRVKIKIIV